MGRTGDDKDSSAEELFQSSIDERKKLKDQVKARIISRKRDYDHEEKYRIVGKKRNFKRTKSETGEILPMPQIVKNRINQM
ncbi:hypothetical protein H5410_018800 [Solanum commersonii]|uniref:Uncharacterized protein n=1 Tax=Solanum commersonii TaxID=4109 RepID=A0A9J6A3I8_SOLCO|nr:hypothetical protein H5410_018800 [Solanum commersonii]